MKKRRISTPQDIYIGQRIREARVSLGMTQKGLAELLGTSYQQLQKYESGSNRISSGRVEQLVTALNRPLSFFFPNATDVRAKAEPELSRFISTVDGNLIAASWYKLTPVTRRSLVTLIQHLAQEAHDD